MIDADLCWRAVSGRDRRFDGVFFTAVRTTGIYCRPICPAPRPKRRNVEFYGCAAAAEGAGFRACRRCRPESAPGTPAWIGTEATVRRGLRLIADGALDDVDAEALAERLGVGGRHLRRLFLQHLGASPSAIGRRRRAHFARRLLAETSLSLDAIQEAAGYGSSRRFRQAINDAFGLPPSRLRGKKVTREGGFQLRLAYRPPLNWARMLEWLSVRATPGLERVEGGHWVRVTPDGDVRVGHDDGALVLTTASPVRALQGIVTRIRKVFDLDCDPRAIHARFESDPVLAEILASGAEVRVPGAWDGFEIAIRAVLGQQVSVKGATTLTGRLVERFGDPSRGLFPSPETLAKSDVAAIGMPASRGRAVQALAAAVSAGDVRFDGSRTTEATRKTLEALPGIGPWTSSYIAMRGLGDPDAFPSRDLGLLKALRVADLDERAQIWRPWRAHAAMLLWQRTTQEIK